MNLKFICLLEYIVSVREEFMEKRGKKSLANSKKKNMDRIHNKIEANRRKDETNVVKTVNGRTQKVNSVSDATRRYKFDENEFKKCIKRN